MTLRMNRVSRRLSTSALLAAALALPVSAGAPAVEYFWVAPTSGNLWDFINGGVGGNLSNWSLTSGGIPTTNAIPNSAGDNATIEQDNAVIVQDGAITIGSLAFTGLNGRLDVTGTSTANATFTVENAFTSAGTIRLTSDSGTSASLVVNGGMTNTGTVHAFDGPGGGLIRNVIGDVTNNGTFDIDATINFGLTGNGATFINNSAFNNAGTTTFGTNSVFTQAGGNLNNLGSFTMSGDTFNFNGGTVTGNALVLNSSTLNIGAASTGVGSFILTGTGGKLSGDIAAAQTLTILGISTANTVTTAQGDVDNAGVINLDSNASTAATLSVLATFTLTNEAGGVIHARTGSSTGRGRTIAADFFVNDGTVNVENEVNLLLNRPSGITTNNGQFNVVSGGEVDFGSNSVFTQAGGNLDNQGDFDMSGDTFNFNGGTVTGNALVLNSATLNIGAGSTGVGAFILTGTGGKLSGDIAAAQTLTILGISTANTVTVAQGDVDNAGVINLDSNASTAATLSALATFTLTNEAGGVIHARTGSGAGRSRTIQADFFSNDGTINVEDQVNLILNRPSGVTTNNGQFNVLSGGEVDFGTNSVFTQAGGNLNNQGDFDMSGDTFNFNDGTVTGNALVLQSSTLNIGAGSTGVGAFILTGGAGKLSGDIAAAQTLTILGISTANTVTVAQGDVDNAGVINLDSNAATAATLSALATSTLTNEAGGVIHARTGSSTGRGRTIAADFLVNDGTINVENEVDLLLNRPSGVTTNNGQFNVLSGGEVDFGSNSVFTQAGGNLDNQGDFDMSGDTFNFNDGTVTGNALVLNSSALNIGLGSVGIAAFNMTGNGSLTGDIALGQTLTVLGTASAHAVTTGQTDVQNDGLIELDTLSTTNSTLAIAGGMSLVNGPGGVLHAKSSTGNGISRDVAADTFINHGTVTVDAGLNLSLNRAAGHTTNNNQFDIAATASVDFGSNSIFTQGGGNLDNQGDFDMSSDTFNFNGGTVTGNALDLFSSNLSIGLASTGAGAFNLLGTSTLSGTIAAAQTVRILGGSGAHAVTTASAGLTNDGTLNLDSLNSLNATLIVTGGLLANNGQLNLDNASGGTSQNRTITAGVVNHGAIVIDVSNAVFNLASATHVSDGTIAFVTGSKLTISGAGTTFTNLAAGTISGTGELQLNNGIVLTNEGTLSPGASAGSLLIDGDLIQTASAQIDIEIGGLTAGTEHDLLTVDGDATLAGTLRVNVINGFAPTAGDVYDVFDFTTSSGTFDTILLGGVGDGNTWDLTNLYTDGELIVIRSGDLNSDGTVDGEDLDILLANWGDSVTAFDQSVGDASGDGIVGNADLQIVLDQFGNTTFPGTATVPEPSSLALLMLGGLFASRRRRR